MGFDGTAPLLHVEIAGRAWMFDLGDPRSETLLFGSATGSDILLAELPARCFTVERISAKVVLLTSYVQGLRLNDVKVKHQATLIDKQTIAVDGQVFIVTLVARQRDLGFADTDDQTVSIVRPDMIGPGIVVSNVDEGDADRTNIGPYPSITESTDIIELRSHVSFAQADFDAASQTAILGTFPGGDEWTSDAYDEWQFEDVRSFYGRSNPRPWQRVGERLLSGGRGPAIVIALLLLCSALLGVTIATFQACIGEDHADPTAQPTACMDQQSQKERHRDVQEQQSAK